MRLYLIVTLVAIVGSAYAFVAALQAIKLAIGA